MLLLYQNIIDGQNISTSIYINFIVIYDIVYEL